MPYEIISDRESSLSGDSWIFEEHGTLHGEFLGRKAAKSKSGKPIAFLIFNADKGNVSVLSGVVLDRIFNDPEKDYKGQKFEIKFLGEKEGRNGNYKDYQVSKWKD